MRVDVRVWMAAFLSCGALACSGGSNVPTDGGKEDHVSMGMTAAIKLRSIIDLAEMITAIELITAAEGLEYRAPLQPGRGVRQAHEIVRRHVTRLTSDRSMSAEIEAIAKTIREGEFDSL